MKYRWLAAVLAVSGSIATAGVPMRPALTQIDPDCRVLGADWQAEYGIKIDDLSNLVGLSNDELDVAEMLKKQLQPLHIIAAADYSCTKTNAPSNIATVRIFVFENTTFAVDWWRKKYEYENWQQHYTKLSGATYSIVDSSQLQKRAMLVGNLWITSHHIRSGKEHMLLLDAVLAQLDPDSSAATTAD